MKKLLTERFQELAGIRPLYQMEEAPGDDLELKSLAKKFIPIIKKYGMGIEYVTDSSKFEIKTFFSLFSSCPIINKRWYINCSNILVKFR